jgi:hypothetical protein
MFPYPLESFVPSTERSNSEGDAIIRSTESWPPRGRPNRGAISYLECIMGSFGHTRA